MHERDFRDRIDLALWKLTQLLGIDVVTMDDGGVIAINPGTARDVHMIRTSWPMPSQGRAPVEDVYCARTLLARCETSAMRGVPARRLARAIQDTMERR